tara:strand:- start:46 stop:672 length:627 start_codon:yes stop_codon:yes gene_type:complete
MPIFHHKKTHGRFFFIHIPRTAGRFLAENFLENGYGIEHHLTEEMVEEQEMLHYLWTPAEGVEIPHAHYSLYKKWKSIKSLSSIAIVRNPIDRFFSASFSFSKVASQSSLENWTTYNNILSKCIRTDVCNWLRPQHEFVSPDTKIWKYEKGFGEKFCYWINNILPINFSIKTQAYTKSNYDQLGLIKTKPLIDNIKKFYRQDFEKFDY